MANRIRTFLAFLILSSVAFGQGVSFQTPPIMSQVPQPIAGLNGAVCLATSTGTPCTPTVSVFSDSALSVPITSLKTDGDGLFPTFFISPGQYQWCASDTLGRISAYCTKFTAPAAAGSSPSFVNLTVTNTATINTLGVTGLFDSHFIFADLQTGSDFCAKVNTAVGLATTGDVIDAEGFTANQTLSTVCTISKSVKLLLPGVTLSCAMADPGTASGCFNVTANNVTFEGLKGQTLITQPNAQRIQVGIQIGSSTNFTMRNVAVNWNEANQTAPSGQFYTFLRSTSGATDIRIEDNDFKACGDRCIDFRATSRVWIKKNYFHETGFNVHGTGGTGNATSVDVTGNTTWEDAWIDDNQFELWGDTAVACPHGSHCHARGNTLRGALDCSVSFPCGSTTSASPSVIESGIDFVGCSDCEAVGNHVINVHNFALDAEAQTVGAVTYVPSQARVTSNEFRHNTGADSDCVINFSASLATGQLANVTVGDNTFTGCRLIVSSVATATITGNTFRDIGTLSAVRQALTIDQSAGSVTKNFVIANNSCDTTDSSITTCIIVKASVTTPGNSYAGGNSISSAVTTQFSNLGTAFPVDLPNAATNLVQYQHGMELLEIAAPSGIALNDVCWADSTAHRPKCNNNNGGAVTPANTSGDTFTSSIFNGVSNGNSVNFLLGAGAAAPVTGNSAEQDLYNVTLLGNSIATGKQFHITAGVNHSTGTASVLYRVRINGVQVYSFSSAATGQNTVTGTFNVTSSSTVDSAGIVIFGNGTAAALGGNIGSLAFGSNQTIRITFNVANTDAVTPSMLSVESVN